MDLDTELGYQLALSKTLEKELPKCELHVHIEGTLEPKMKLQLAKRNKVELPYKNEKAVIYIMFCFLYSQKAII